MSDFTYNLGFRSAGERLENERQGRLQNTGRILSFGVAYLDKALGGIFPNDLILLGARTGIGKTALASHIAFTNVKAGKRVHYFALEAEPLEIERRLKFKTLGDLLYERQINGRDKFNYLDWYLGKCDWLVGSLENEADELLRRHFHTLYTLYRVRDFTVTDFEKRILAVQNDTDLVVLDHLHYVDTEESDENRGYKQIVKRIRDCALDIGKPVIVVAHVRKADRKQKALVPELDDFHGTSDVPKIATKAIMIAHAYDRPTGKTHLWNTYFTTPKCRTDGSRTRFSALITYNASKHEYVEEFVLGRLSVAGDEWHPVEPHETPHWARWQ